jgi:hypothetical protein
MAESEGDSAQVVGQKAGEEHSHHHPDALVVPPLAARLAHELPAGPVDIPGYGNVTPDENHQHCHKQAAVDVDDGLMPLGSQRTFEFHAFVNVLSSWLTIG